VMAPKMSGQEIRLKIEHVSKHFEGVQVLNDINLEIFPGELHGLVGQNGSGKSTLIKILTGVHAPDAGAHLEIDGREIRTPVSWRDVHKAGISVVHQDFGIIDTLTVADNICVGSFPTRRKLHMIDRKERNSIVSDLLQRLNCDVSPLTIAEELSPGERASVAIARAIKDHINGNGMIILDESTRTLRGHDLDHIYRLLYGLVSEGTSVLMISHSIDEIFTVANRVSVLRDGQLVASGLEMANLEKDQLAYQLLGRNLETSSVNAKAEIKVHGEVKVENRALAISGLTGGSINSPIEFEVAAGEVLGITGVVGSGFEDIPYLAAGAIPAKTGVLELANGKYELRKLDPKQSIKNGLVLIPERRDRDGVALERSMRDNLTLPSTHKKAKRYFIGLKWQRELYDEAIKMLEIKTPGSLALIRQLSGGNQQKVLVAKWLATSPHVLIAHEPTQAVDIGAREDIRQVLKDYARRGMAVIVVSSDPDDLVSVSNRILVYTEEDGLTEVAVGNSSELLAEVYETSEIVASRGV